MKIKLLKRLRKRFKWRLTNENRWRIVDLDGQTIYLRCPYRPYGFGNSTEAIEAMIIARWGSEKYSQLKRRKNKTKIKHEEQSLVKSRLRALNMLEGIE